MLVRGTATIYRPTATLFLLLKLGRLTATDLDDCLALIAHTERTLEPLDRERVKTALAPCTDRRRSPASPTRSARGRSVHVARADA